MSLAPNLNAHLVALVQISYAIRDSSVGSCFGHVALYLSAMACARTFAVRLETTEVLSNSCLPLWSAIAILGNLWRYIYPLECRQIILIRGLETQIRSVILRVRLSLVLL